VVMVALPQASAAMALVTQEIELGGVAVATAFHDRIFQTKPKPVP
jgi:hypothetical protein